MFNRAAYFFPDPVTHLGHPPGGFGTPSRRCTQLTAVRAQSAKPSEGGSPSFGAIRRSPRVHGCGQAHDLGRASTRTDPIHPGHMGFGRGGAGMDPRGHPRPGGEGRRVRVRLDRPGRHGGGGGRGRRPLAHSAVPVTEPAPDSGAHPHAQAAARAAARPQAAARTATDTEARATAPTTAHSGTAPPAGAETGRRPHPHADPHADPDTLAQAEPAPLGASGALSAVPPGVPPTATARRPLTAHVHPAHRRTSGVRRRRDASALISGGTSCRNGLFSPSPWRPPAPS